MPPPLKVDFKHKIIGKHSPKKLGTGAWGEVSRLYERETLKPYAVKVVQKQEDEDEQDYADRVYDEFETAHQLVHPNVIRTFRLCARRCRWCVVMEYCAKGDLTDCVGYLTYQEKLCLFKQLLHGVEYLHNQGFVHRDIKLENILLNEDGHLKIADFGTATTGDPDQGSDALKWCEYACGTPHTSPPEIYEDFYDGRAVDVWACAMTLLILFSVHIEFDEAHVKWFEEHMGSLSRSLTEDAREYGSYLYGIENASLFCLLHSMLHPNPEVRPTISQALDHFFVRRIECCCPAPNSRDGVSLLRHNHGPPLPPCSPPPRPPRPFPPSPSPSPPPSPPRSKMAKLVLRFKRGN